MGEEVKRPFVEGEGVKPTTQKPTLTSVSSLAEYELVQYKKVIIENIVLMGELTPENLEHNIKEIKRISRIDFGKKERDALKLEIIELKETIEQLKKDK